MGDLERISQAQLSSALTGQGAFLRKSLSNEDSSTLLAEMESLARRYPTQDQESSIKDFFLDYEQLALRYSLAKVLRALAELRLSSKFFPRPDEVREAIEDQREIGMTPTPNDAKRYLRELSTWKQEHAEYRAELESRNAESAA